MMLAQDRVQCWTSILGLYMLSKQSVIHKTLNMFTVNTKMDITAINTTRLRKYMENKENSWKSTICKHVHCRIAFQVHSKHCNAFKKQFFVYCKVGFMLTRSFRSKYDVSTSFLQGMLGLAKLNTSAPTSKSECSMID
jgi:hypothetical protein